MSEPTTPSRTIDLNADLGEGCPWDEPLLGRVTSASICCGFHAGDRNTIRRTIGLALARHVALGAHPGYADRESFGRKERPISAAEAERLIVEQVEALRAIAAPAGASIRFLKPHGALYNQAQRDAAIASGVVAAAAKLTLPLLGQPGSQVERLAKEQGVYFVAEGFADRRYGPDGRLVPRDQPGAILEDPREIEAQVVRLAGQGIATVCLHGDNPKSVTLADLVVDVLRREGIARRSFIDVGRG